MFELTKMKLLGFGAGGLSALVTALIGYTDMRYESTKEYVDQKHEQVSDKLEDIKGMLIKIDERLYDLKKEK